MEKSNLKKPPLTRNFDGEERRVGVEIEFSGLVPEDAAKLVAEWQGVAWAPTSNPFIFSVPDTKWGDFSIELDTKYISADEMLEKALEDAGIRLDKKNLELSREVAKQIRDIIGNASTGWVPTEIVSPPIPWSELGEFSALVSLLRNAGAQGTDEKLLYSFGLHLNPEFYSNETADILAVLKAEIILSDWLREKIKVDPTRQIFPHIDPFPESYAQLVLDEDYWPDIDQVIEDYITFNPTRNRELDMLPAFSYLSPKTVENLIEDDRIKARPTFHYRLPNVLFQDSAWSISAEWNRWVSVETLASDPEALKEMSRHHLKMLNTSPVDKIAKEVSSWVKRFSLP